MVRTFQSNYGESVALSSDGKVLAIGEPHFIREDIPGGRVQVFRLGEDEWQQIGEDIFGRDLNDEMVSFGSQIRCVYFAVGRRFIDCHWSISKRYRRRVIRKSPRVPIQRH